MGFGAYLQDLLSGIVQIESLIDNSDNSQDVTINITSGEGDPVVKKDGEKIIATVPDSSIKNGNTKELMDKIGEGFEEGYITDLVKASSSEKYSKVKETVNDQDIEEIKSFFEDKISSRHQEMLEAALHYRKLANQGFDTNDLNEDIQGKYGREGIKLKNLVAANYMDEGGYIRELYQEADNSEDFEDRFEEIVRFQPFTVFVSFRNELDEIYMELLRKLRKYNRYDVKFVDIRGIGSDNIDRINDAVQLIEDKFGDFEYDRRQENGELRVRINPESYSWEMEEEN